ncbi:TetR/AcrR family transcriptional regulator [Streptomyces sp. AV19]|nr:TetR/AcrR family transcriptional regulator [Streptomyces sp. AV19]
MLHAADDLLAERGFAALTIEGIAARAGVAKQTIYRWWRSKVDILLDAVTQDAHEALDWQAPGGDGPEEYLRAHLRRVAAFFEQPAGLVLRALLGHAQLDAEAAEALRSGFLREQRERDVAGLRAVLERHTGRAVDERTADRLTDVLLGPLYYRPLAFGETAGPEVTDATARLVLELAADRPVG